MRRLAKGRRLPRLEGITRRLKRSKRLIINRRGDGVHSPYAFHLISRVIRNRRPYYCFAELREELRRHTRELARAERPRPIRSSSFVSRTRSRLSVSSSSLENRR